MFLDLVFHFQYGKNFEEQISKIKSREFVLLFAQIHAGFDF